MQVPVRTRECGGDCCKPREDVGDPDSFFAPFRNMINMMGQSGAGRGGSRRAMFARSARSSSAAVDAALVALAAVNGQGAVAMLAIREGKRDPAFRQKVKVTRARPPTLSADAVLNAGPAAALNKLLVAEAEAYALIAAMATALWRARAAHAKKNSAAASSQLRASATFAAQAATALKKIQGLRTAAAKALKAGKVPEAWAFDTDVDAFIAAVRSGGIPASLRAPMGKLGVRSADLKRLRAGRPRPGGEPGRRACPDRAAAGPEPCQGSEVAHLRAIEVRSARAEAPDRALTDFAPGGVS